MGVMTKSMLAATLALGASASPTLMRRDCANRGDAAGAWNAGAADGLANDIAKYAAADQLGVANAQHTIDQWVYSENTNTDPASTPYSCDTLGSNNCPQPAACNTWSNIATFYQLTAFANLNDYVSQVHDTVFDQALIDGLAIPDIISDYQSIIDMIQTLETASMWGAVSTGIGIAGAAAGVVPEGGAIIGAGASIFSSILTAVTPNTDDVDISSDAQNAMSSWLSKTVDSFDDALTNFNGAAFANGDLGYGDTGGAPLSHLLADGAFLDPFIKNSDYNNYMQGWIKKGLIGALFTGAGMGVLSYPDAGDNTCDTVYHGVVSGSDCLSVTVPGQGGFGPLDPATYTQLNNDGIETIDFLQVSIDCANNGAGNAQFDASNPTQVNGYPRCFFNLPYNNQS